MISQQQEQVNIFTFFKYISIISEKKLYHVEPALIMKKKFECFSLHYYHQKNNWV